MAQGNAVLIVRVQIDPVDSEEFNRWYDQEHVPEKLATEGFVGARRFQHNEEPNTYLVIYELKDAAAATSAAYMSQAPTDWGKSVMARWKKWQRDVWVDLATDERPQG